MGLEVQTRLEIVEVVLDVGQTIVGPRHVVVVTLRCHAAPGGGHGHVTHVVTPVMRAPVPHVVLRMRS